MKSLVLPQSLWNQCSIDLTSHRITNQLLSQKQAYSLGKEQRNKANREQIGNTAKRPETVSVLDIYTQSNVGRLPHLVPIRTRRMLESPLAFYRGLPSLMLLDQAWEAHSGLFQVICGDCHLSNFGGFASPERNLIFGINDFDETIVAPFEWDIKRLATSLLLTSRQQSLSDKVGLSAIEVMLESYLNHLEVMSKLSPLEVWYESIDAKDLIEATQNRTLRKFRKNKLKQAVNRNTDSVLPKLTAKDENGKRHFTNELPLLYAPTKNELFFSHIPQFFESYKKSLKADRQLLFSRYDLSDIAIKVVGVGSVGTQTAIALFEDGDRSPLILQMKQARPSVLSSILPVRYKHEGQRTVEDQQLLQASSDIFLGYATHPRKRTPFMVRQLRDMKVTINIEELDEIYLKEYAHSCGMALAHAQGKAGQPDVLLGYLGGGKTLINAMQHYAIQSADRTLLDYAEFQAYAHQGILDVATGDVI